MKRSVIFVIVSLFFIFQSYGINTALWVEAGDDITSCESINCVWIEAQATSAGFVDWWCNGDGFFSYPNELSTCYYPGPGDIFTGHVILYITVSNSESGSLTDSLTLTIMKAPVSQTITYVSGCEPDSVVISAQSFNSSSHFWSTTGDGFFDNPFNLLSVYYPGNNDISFGVVDLCLISFPVQPCIQPDVSCLTLEIFKKPFVDAGEDVIVCENHSAQLNATVQNYSSFHWESSGDGTFSNQYLSNPLYTPGNDDKTTDGVHLWMTAASISPCQGFQADTLMLHLRKEPVVTAGISQTICVNQTVSLSGSAQNSSGIYWITYGDGTFNCDTVVNPVYFPGENDKQYGWIFLELNALPLSPCENTMSAYTFVEIQDNPSVWAGNDITACSDSVTLLASAEEFGNISWSSSGDGSFGESTHLSTTYFPGTGDIALGTVILTILAAPVFPCLNFVSDEIVVTMHETHIINQALNDTTIFSGEELELLFEVNSNLAGIYKWFLNGEEQAGVNTPVFFIENAQPQHAGYYQCVFTNSCAETVSDICLVKIHQRSSQEFNLPAGWSGISSFIYPENANFDSLFKPIIGSIITIMDDSGIFIPQHNLNTLGNWTVPHGYHIKLEDTCLLSMSGVIEFPVQVISLPPGWSVLPHNYFQLINVSEVFDTIPGISIIKEVAGIKMYWPAMHIRTLDCLIPGKAYQVLNSTQNCIPIDFSGGGTKYP